MNDEQRLELELLINRLELSCAWAENTIDAAKEFYHKLYYKVDD